jgi:drug/metabolite transporter (DMT)-like permease
MLALHFWSWNTSIQLTSVAASVLLVNTQPLVAGALSAIWLHERPTARQWLGIVVAIVGAVIVVLPDVTASSGRAFAGRGLAGDGLALVGALTAGTYYVIGRRLRSSLELDLWAYVAVVYGTCLVALLIIALAAHVRLAPYAPREFGIFALLALGPMLLGHTALNWALRHVRAYLVNVVLLGEPIIATVLAALLPGIRERPGSLTVVGGACVLAGIAIAERSSPT